ncbi:unnamed protein product [Lupinus luteus]|uniref:Uncharacterized protein n=1 Tax=Lupinus luteus TaxID=3873 RepID=A0AAV1XYX5_LUPLU
MDQFQQPYTCNKIGSLSSLNVIFPIYHTFGSKTCASSSDSSQPDVVSTIRQAGLQVMLSTPNSALSSSLSNLMLCCYCNIVDLCFLAFSFDHEAIDSLGLEVQQAVIICFNGFALDVFRAEQCRDQDLLPGQIKAVLLQASGFHGMSSNNNLDLEVDYELGCHTKFSFVTSIIRKICQKFTEADNARKKCEGNILHIYTSWAVAKNSSQKLANRDKYTENKSKKRKFVFTVFRLIFMDTEVFEGVKNKESKRENHRLFYLYPWRGKLKHCNLKRMGQGNSVPSRNTS